MHVSNQLTDSEVPQYCIKISKYVILEIFWNDEH
jgi:hypothetical protein